MKKVIIAIIGMVLVMTSVIGGYAFAKSNDQTVDEKNVIKYAIAEHGEGNYEVEILDGTDENGINYVIYEDGDARWFGWVSRSYAEHIGNS